MTKQPIDDIIEELLFNTRAAYKEVGITKVNWENYKQRMKDGKLSHAKKQEILTKFGYRLAEFEMWEK